ncbi:heparinase II/III-family protein [Vibrio tubiashii]|uniref:heparinase II/III family protein n=2 Tax=Vibrio tubiashii TaxID=29498 RepID=UPI001EFDADBC|nr:heparinase II/III-family protein [Vibrio tubiashii]MCG9617720.1 heparinase II/III-family protein [Vibrio tubiashii]
MSKEIHTDEVFLKSYKPFYSDKIINFSIASWDYNILTDEYFSFGKYNWTDINCELNEKGDVKGVWELSRLNWSVKLALGGSVQSVEVLNKTLDYWTSQNPPYFGINWLCGQEAAYRVLNLACSEYLLSGFCSSSGRLIDLIKVHLERIEQTIDYAIAQDNNHAITEAAALYIGGMWVHAHSPNEGKEWAKIGRKVLENRVEKLIESDGSFSMYSTNYHRCILDVISLVEIIRLKLRDGVFSRKFYNKMELATLWLYYFVQKKGGGAPNLGANDGTLLFSLDSSKYSDFRQTVQLSAALFNKCLAYSELECDEKLNLFGVSRPDELLPIVASKHFEKGGYVCLKGRVKNSMVLFNYPVSTFRPSQVDPLHVDFWVDGDNLLRDGGSFSYNTSKEKARYFSGTQSHNTIQFDNYEPMSRIGPFLFSGWLSAHDVSFDSNNNRTSACYTDRFGAKHCRSLVLDERCLIVDDSVSGFKSKAVLRWRLKPANWVVTNDGVKCGDNQLRVSSDADIDIKLVNGFESRHYYNMTEVPVLEVTAKDNCNIRTEYLF